MPTRTIWKFPLAITDRQFVEMPSGSLIMTAQFQGDTLCLWALVHPNAATEAADIRVIGTGNPVPGESLRYIATAQMPSTPLALVWHVFEAA